MGAVEAEPRTVEEVFGAVLDARLPDYDPWLYRYYGYMSDLASARTFLRRTEDLLNFGGVRYRRARALDVGSGFGFTLLALASLGVGEAHGLELHEPMVDTIRAYLPVIPAELADRIVITHGSAMEMPYDDESFDLLLSIEAISHYRDVEGFIREAERVLRPHGALIISDGNNGLNRRRRREDHELWVAFERGGTGKVVHGHLVDHCYEDDRRRFIEQSFPDIPAERMAHETFAMTIEEVAEACRQYELHGVFPGSVFDGTQVPLDPNTGAVIERLFNPYALARQIEAVGFDTKVRGYWGGARGRPIIRLANNILAASSRLTISSAHTFVIAARKQH